MFNRSDESRVFTLPRAILLFFALTTLGFGIFFLLHFTPIFHNIVRSQLILSPGTQGYEAWSKPQISTYIRFYLFSVLNPEEVEAGGKPRLEQIGPFVYREELERVDQDFSKFGNVNFRTRKVWYPISKESVSLDTLITTLDIPQFAAAESVRGKWSEFMMRSTLSWRPSLFTQKTARELLFDGFSDPLLTAGAFFNPDSKVPLDKFGWFYGRNGTTWADDVIGMATGEQNYTQLGEIKTWKNSTRTHYSGKCGQLKGSASGFLPVNLKRTSFDFFSTDICRPIRFQKSEEFIHNKLPVHKFSVNPMETFGNESTNPENICYNTFHPAGIHNSTGCKDAGILPVFVSLPHFLDADPSYLKQFQPAS
ncbi:protein peste isoform X2 [Eurytemora carolleeae]|uniref:protein peste isoform X2 n=1 Tax=Eurytemora carolleeae TaxID=1294199 RepID=UPI000C759FA2|nr:protein peste isoform X2 [Eurytemora carolleeae]|eukprot:XP_023327668.1 protein peste-like isoform X2 [Eurytemora affinis]